MWNLFFYTLNKGGLGEGFFCLKKKIFFLKKEEKSVWSLRLFWTFRISRTLSCYFWNCSVSNLIPDQILHTHTYCFPFKPTESSLFYICHPLQLSQPLQAEIRCLRRMQKEWRKADFLQSPRTSFCHETSMLLLRLCGWVKLGKAFSSEILCSCGVLASFSLVVYDKYLDIPFFPQVLDSSMHYS